MSTLEGKVGGRKPCLGMSVHLDVTQTSNCEYFQDLSTSAHSLC